MNQLGVLILLSCSLIQAKEELKFVQVVWRHGDRAPGDLPYPKDKNGEENWPRGWNQLTNEGILQLRELGEFFHQRYVGSFLKESFHHKEVYIRSTDKDRALVSAQSMLSAMFPPTQSEMAISGMAWQPIAVHGAEPGAEDPLLKPTKFKCPAYDKIYKPLREEKKKKLGLKYYELFKFLGNNTGISNFTLDDIKAVEEINKEFYHKIPQPDWVYQNWPKYGGKTTLELIMEINIEERAVRFSTTELSRLRGGFLLGDFMQNAKKAGKGKMKKPKKMLLYSAHEGTLQSIMNAFGFETMTKIPYAGCLIMEVRGKKNKATVEFLFYGDKKLTPLKLRACQEVCPLEKAEKLMEYRSIKDKVQLYQDCGRFHCDDGEESDDDEKPKKGNTKKR
ncbi:unnamed protein product [Bursaphelenchus xylophilus]|uniref:(pine wood nematode) hypothetical protein n=1 Tax=Bursaphelenchus xylophilus TaxID=6326 RepID=A0A1I7RIN6_BURXY|nr:unnamed protein product [Bursaphelenchus xylophilus]CAG9118955.1 unnamed protein product [Bursaphelenchus xylophilus]